jgi:hypothetical protein
MRRERIRIGTVALFRLVICWVVLSSSAASVYIFGADVWYIRGVSGAVGVLAAILGAGVAAWFCLRSRSPKLLIAGLLSVLPLGFWVWVVYEITQGRRPFAE